MSTAASVCPVEENEAAGCKPVGVSRSTSNAALAPAQMVGTVFFPLDEEWGRTSSDLTPHAQEGLVRLATWVPDSKAAQLLERLLGVEVSQATAHRWTTHAVYEEWEEQTAQREQSQPEACKQADQQVMSADGAMGALVGGGWADVKTLVIGEGETTSPGEKRVQNLSSCSRLADVAGCAQATFLETHRRGIEQARDVAAVMDGADWLQGCVEYHRADAVRILDVAHAAEDVHALGEAVQRAGHRLPGRWLDGVLHRLTHDGPERVLLHLARLCQRCSTSEVRTTWQSLLQRHSHMHYPLSRAAGWPSGSGMVESANTLVGEARLKGAGMHWKREHVHPMLLLRHAVCNDRWSDTWQRRLKQAQRQRQQQRQQHRQLRLQQAQERLIQLVLPILLSQPRPQASVGAPAGTLPAPVSSPAPTGRTQAQYRWGRRPISPRGTPIQAGFAQT